MNHEFQWPRKTNKIQKIKRMLADKVPHKKIAAACNVSKKFVSEVSKDS